MHHVYYSKIYLMFLLLHVINTFYLISAIMSASNPIIALLANESLTSDNFVKWKSNVNIVLVCENNRFVLIEECPAEPAANAARSVRESYERWI